MLGLYTGTGELKLLGPARCVQAGITSDTAMGVQNDTPLMENGIKGTISSLIDGFEMNQTNTRQLTVLSIPIFRASTHFTGDPLGETALKPLKCGGATGIQLGGGRELTVN